MSPLPGYTAWCMAGLLLCAALLLLRRPAAWFFLPSVPLPSETATFVIFFLCLERFWASQTRNKHLFDKRTYVVRACDSKRLFVFGRSGASTFY